MKSTILALGMLLAAALPSLAATPLDTAYANVAAASAAASKAASAVAADEAAVSSAATAVQNAQASVFPAANLPAVVSGNAVLVKAIAALSTAEATLDTDIASLAAAQTTLQAQMAALATAVTAADTGGTPPLPLPESANLTSVPPLAAITDANGDTWTITPGGQVAKDGIVDTKTGKVGTLAYVNHVLWQNAPAYNLWWPWNGTTWGTGTAADPRVTTPPPPTGGRSNLVGVYMDPADSPTFSSYMGFPPDLTINNSYAGPGGGGSNICTQNGGYPSVAGNSTYDANSGMGDPNAAANGNYNAAYASLMQNFYGPCAATIYALRLNWEWPGYWFDFSPSWSSGGQLPQSQWVSPATWIAGWRNFVTALRANPATAHIKVSWDYPMLQYGGAAALAYYPGDAYVDIISADYYFNPQYDRATSAQAWAKATSAGGLNDMAAFATAHGKPMAFWEFADMYTDGFCTAQFVAWMAGKNIAAVVVWDSNDAIGGGDTAALESNAARKAAFVAAFANTKYTGTWPKLALPATLPAGY